MRADDGASDTVERAALGAERNLVLETIQAHAASLLRTARRYSLCAEDAEDAYQRGLEIFIKRAHTVRPEGAPAWLRTVIKHEAFALRQARQRALGATAVNLDRDPDTGLPTEDERVLSFDLKTRAAEALQRLKPHELRALVLKAQGHSYAEICELTGWTYTKVNRLLTEGRRSFTERCADIEAGRECERWAPVLSAIVDGEARAQDTVRARPHLRNCPACRTVLAEYRDASRQVAALVPLAALPVGSELGEVSGGVLSRLYELVVGGVGDRLALAAHKAQATIELAAASKTVAVAASAAALAGGGAAVGGALEASSKPPLRASARVDPAHARSQHAGAAQTVVPPAPARESSRSAAHPARPAQDGDPAAEFSPEPRSAEHVPATQAVPRAQVSANPAGAVRSAEFGP